MFLEEAEGQDVLHQKMRGFLRNRQVSRCTQKIRGKGRWSIVCYRGKCCWCDLKFSWKGRWICCWTYMGPNCFCCRTYWCMVDAEGAEKVGRDKVGHGVWPGIHCRVQRMHITLVSLVFAFCDRRKFCLSRLMPSACIACLSLRWMWGCSCRMLQGCD